MATVKDLLKTAILKVGSNGAMPSNQIITLVSKSNFNSPNSYETVEYVAPCDGVLSAFFQGSGINSGVEPGVDITDADGHRHAARTTDGSVHMNLRKGCAAGARFYEASHSVAQWAVRFTKTIGGRYKRYLPTLSRNRFGGLPCLKASCAKPSQLISEISERGYLSKAFQNSRSNTHPSSRQTAMTTGAGSTRLQMVGSLFNSTNTDSLWTLRTRREELPFASPRSEGMGPSRRSCRQGKETRSRTTCSQQSHLLRTREWFSTAVSEHQANNNSFMEVAA